ncbi:MAG: hypothetical protein EP332_01660 [Bacteroidetes bacterium]|nr:MAG: hypothetical protein EP332_01660 [Bacteroidota bacterium]
MVIENPKIYPAFLAILLFLSCSKNHYVGPIRVVNQTQHAVSVRYSPVNVGQCVLDDSLNGVLKAIVFGDSADLNPDNIDFELQRRKKDTTWVLFDKEKVETAGYSTKRTDTINLVLEASEAREIGFRWYKRHTPFLLEFLLGNLNVVVNDTVTIDPFYLLRYMSTDLNNRHGRKLDLVLDSTLIKHYMQHLQLGSNVLSRTEELAQHDYYTNYKLIYNPTNTESFYIETRDDESDYVYLFRYDRLKGVSVELRNILTGERVDIPSITE